jgi:hypothetical protein
MVGSDGFYYIGNQYIGSHIENEEKNKTVTGKLLKDFFRNRKWRDPRGA